METITGISHVTLSVRDLAASAAWYREVLGLTTVRESHEEGRELVVLQHPGTGLRVVLRHHPGGDRLPFDERRTGLDHVSFLVSGRAALEGWKASFERLGVAHSPIADEPYGSVLVFRDPDNIQLELFAAPGT